MLATVREYGTRQGSITTLGRTNVNAGSKVLVDMLSEQEWADLAVLTIDWVGDTFTPVLNLEVAKFFPEYNGSYLRVSENYDIDELFGLDNADNALLQQIVNDLKTVFEEAVAAGPPRS